jgi:4a-hydroxytetrahydrobiopterin dehydratase
MPRRLTTHDVDGISGKDIEMALLMNRIAAALPAAAPAQ